MQVSANIIRFPSQPAPVVHHSEPQPQEPAGIVAFPDSADHDIDSQAQQHGQLFAAHRIVTRVADQLDHIAAL